MKTDLFRKPFHAFYTNRRTGKIYVVWGTPLITCRDGKAWLICITSRSGGVGRYFVRYSRGQYFSVLSDGLAPISIRREYPGFNWGVICSA